jgi:hypothetical protein
MLHNVQITFPQTAETKQAKMPLDKVHQWVSDSIKGRVPEMHSTHFTQETLRENGVEYTETILRDVQKRPVAFIWVEKK